MKVCWIQDIDPFVDPGGAQQTDRAHIVHALRQGYEVEVMLPGHDPSMAESAGLVIVSNATMFPIKLFQDMKKPYIFFFHDYWPACKVRLYYPMLEKCKSCPSRPGWLPVLKGAKLLVWLSPLHRESWLFSYPELEDRSHALVPSPVSPDRFYNMGLERHGAIAVNSGIDFKGRDRFFEWANEHPETPITLIGPGADKMPGNIKVIGAVPPEKMNEIYNRHEVFVHQPVSPSPFDRTVAEAFLAGCRVVGNELVGALSWPFFRQGREAVVEALRCSSTRFWQAIEEVADV